MCYPFEIVWMTTRASGTPHAAALQAANPGLRIHTHTAPDETGPDRVHAWRNCDRNIRDWWRKKSPIVTADAVLFLEYDVYCDVDLRNHIPTFSGNFGCAAASILSGLRDIRRFWPFADIPRLPRSMQALACATAPLAVLLISRAALDAMLHPLHDAIFAADIFCETRLPTVIRFEGFQVHPMPLPQVGCTPCQPTHPGIWHPVKSSVQSLI